MIWKSREKSKPQAVKDLVPFLPIFVPFSLLFHNYIGENQRETARIHFPGFLENGEGKTVSVLCVHSRQPDAPYVMTRPH